MRIFLVLATFVLASSVRIKRPFVRPVPIETTVCDVVANPEAFNETLVTFTAASESDGIERSLLLGTDCPTKGGLMPYVMPGAPGASALDDALYRTGRPDGLEKTVTATFTGTFHYLKKPEMCMFLRKEVCRRTFSINSIRNLTVVMKQKE